MTHLEAFEKVKAHLLQQGQRSLLPDNNWKGEQVCAYRGKDGLKCAIGVLISDEEYDPSFESKRASVISGMILSLRSLHCEFLEALQHIHDSCPPLSWSSELDLFEENWAHLLAPAPVAP